MTLCRRVIRWQLSQTERHGTVEVPLYNVVRITTADVLAGYNDGRIVVSVDTSPFLSRHETRYKRPGSSWSERVLLRDVV